MKHIKLLFLLLLVSGFGFGQEIASYSSQANPACSGVVNNDANITANGICRGSGINQNAGGTYNSNSWSNGATISTNDYLEWTMTPNAGFEINLTNMDIRYDRSPTGPTMVDIQVDDGSGYVSVFTDAAVSATSESNDGIDLSAFTNITTTLTFRLYAFNSGASSGTFDIESHPSYTLNKGIVVNGTADPICPTTVTWDGTVWDNVTGPTSSDAVVLNGSYSTLSGTNSFNGCSLTIASTATLNIADNTFVEIENDIINNGVIIIADKGSLVQVEELAVFTNLSTAPVPVTVAKRTAPVVAWYEYTYWSSPVPEATLEGLLPNTAAVRKFSFDASQFHDNQAEIFNTGTFTANARDDIDDDANDWQYASGIMTPGIGYSATLGPDDLLGPGGGSTGILQSFEGSTLNSGTFNIPVDRNDTSSLDNNWNLIGNPYPSAIDASDFLDENVYNATTNPDGTLEGAIYLWSHSTAPSATTSGNEQINFDVNDYAVINLSANVAGEQYTPTDFIPSGQGFFVLVDNNATIPGNVVFNNSMRVSGNNDQFFRTNQTNLDNKLWLNLTSDNGVFSQLAIAYVDGATNGNDSGSYDARRFYSGGSAMLVSFAENSDVPLAIQGKQTNALNLDEIIPLGFTTGITSPTIYTISIDHFQGDFLANNTVYLKDNLTSTIHDLSASDYSFTSGLGAFDNRFEVVFNNASLSTNDFILNKNSLSIIELQNDDVLFKTGSELTIKSVQIFDALGRNIYSFKGNNNKETYNLANLNQATYVAQIELSNGQLISKKAIKK